MTGVGQLQLSGGGGERRFGCRGHAAASELGTSYWLHQTSSKSALLAGRFLLGGVCPGDSLSVTQPFQQFDQIDSIDSISILISAPSAPSSGELAGLIGTAGQFTWRTTRHDHGRHGLSRRGEPLEGARGAEAVGHRAARQGGGADGAGQGRPGAEGAGRAARDEGDEARGDDDPGRADRAGQRDDGHGVQGGADLAEQEGQEPDGGDGRAAEPVDAGQPADVPLDRGQGGDRDRDRRHGGDRAAVRRPPGVDPGRGQADRAGQGAGVVRRAATRTRSTSRPSRRWPRPRRCGSC